MFDHGISYEIGVLRKEKAIPPDDKILDLYTLIREILVTSIFSFFSQGYAKA